ncbi:putative late blight resistance protein homolog R1A-10 [Diospyros lotus]|uniref:putative late blight resistance protein homolog R1A-10 n=1 Tax=Diospyros lotus TaxID=55363 RepID=UPI002252B1CD|nr:putative late blight resistance protein homolog R1A-10 [Diospyros lotus]
MDSAIEDVVEGALSDVHDLQGTLYAILNRDGLDMAAKKCHFIAEFLNYLKSIDASEACVAFDRPRTGMHWWLFIETDYYRGLYGPLKRENNQLIDAANHAAYNSFAQVMMELRQQTACLHFSASKKTIKAPWKRVLAYFDGYCKNLSVENSFYVANLRGNIQKAADFAKQYMSQEADQLQFPEDKLDRIDYYCMRALQWGLRGNYVLKDTSSDMQHAAKAYMDDDDDIVGLDGDSIKIKQQLTSSLSELKIIPIVGMGGIGKTTLTRRVYEDPQIMVHFPVRAWTIVSEEYHERDVLLRILKSIAPLPEQVCKEHEGQLADRLYRRLKGWRYFIVLDDIWTTQAWDRLKLCFPDDNNGSRIIVTSRISDVACYVSPENSPHFMNFLGLEDSWDLLLKQVFGKEACPPQLVSVGKQIVEKCRGLPLAIKVVAGHLSNCSKKQEYWQDAAESVSLATEVSQMESLLNILSISYNHLPQQLKACFLTMVTFLKNFEIPVRKLVTLWAAMGFLHPNVPKTVEEVAMMCLKDLIARNLIMVTKRKFDGKVKLCGVHDLLWDLSMREARKEGNSIFGNNISLSHSYFNGSNDINYVMGLSSTLRYFDHSFESDCPIGCSEFKLLKILDILNQSFDHFPDEITELVNLRYLELATSSNIPESVSKLCHLETLINNHEGAAPTLPNGIWSLARLKHLHTRTCSSMAKPPSSEGGGCVSAGLPNLETLSNLSFASCTEDVLLKIPNLKELRIHETEEELDVEGDQLLFSSLSNLICLNQLEIFKLCCNAAELDQKPRCIPQWDSFIPNIKQLTLVGCYLPWSEINALAMLPDLEVLKLKGWPANVGSEWELVDEEFLQLKCLVLDRLPLMLWNANQDHFPNLQCLIIRNCPNLFSIPLEFGNIPTLQLIDLEYCSSQAFESARQIQREQLNMGNDKLKVCLGRLIQNEQFLSLVNTVVYMNSRLKIQRGAKTKRVRCKKHFYMKNSRLKMQWAKKLIRSKKMKRKEDADDGQSEVSVGECSSNSTLIGSAK